MRVSRGLSQWTAFGQLAGCDHGAERRRVAVTGSHGGQNTGSGGRKIPEGLRFSFCDLASSETWLWV